MNLSQNWLGEYVAHGLATDDLADTLTMLGLEVEEVTHVGPEVDGVVVGHVLDTRPHPDADRLTLCTVDLSAHNADSEPVQIVCSAPNVAPGQKVPVATVGTTLMLPSRKDPHTKEPVQIKKGKIRGEVSFGMICAEDELGLGDDHDGILVLEDNAEAGTPFADYLEAHGLAERDTVIEIAITPNRPDATSHLGVARDVAAVTHQHLAPPVVDEPEAGGAVAEHVGVEIEDAAACPRYAAMLIRGVTVAESPAWLKRRLEAIGERPINNVVDVTNYVLFELGQPLHAFDADLLAGNASKESSIVVRMSEPGESFTTLDDVERKLPEDTLMVCDAERSVAIAGIMGGQNSEVSDGTTNVLLESAYFDPVTIRRAAKGLGLQTNASYRFERGVDPNGAVRAAARAAALIAELAGGKIVPGIVDAYPAPIEPKKIALRPARVTQVLGVEIDTDEIVRLLTAIGIEVNDDAGTTLAAFAEGVLLGETPAAAAESADDAALRCTIPTFRPDIEREIDLIEEVARLYGYDNIPQPGRTMVPLRPQALAPSLALRHRTLQHLVGLGFREVYSNSLLPNAVAEQFAAETLVGEPWAVAATLNPQSEEMAVLRPSLLPGLLTAMAYNQNRGAGALRLAEFGHVYGRTADAARTAESPVEGYRERTNLIIGMSGRVQEAGWDQSARAVDFYDVKGVVAHVLDSLGLPLDSTSVFTEAVTTGDALLAYRLDVKLPGRGGGVVVGTIARVSDTLMEQYALQQPVFFAELDWDALVQRAAKRLGGRYEPISRFPVVERDLAVAVASGEPVGPMLQTVRKAGGKLLQDARVFDLYQGDRIEAGQKSVAFALRFGADRTLTDKQVDKQMKGILKQLTREHSATLRG
ncbi:MAG: phenylalanine--tRNA ligase subunit beta [Bacteroidota bacterium]